MSIALGGWNQTHIRILHCYLLGTQTLSGKKKKRNQYTRNFGWKTRLVTRVRSSAEADDATILLTGLPRVTYSMVSATDIVYFCSNFVWRWEISCVY